MTATNVIQEAEKLISTMTRGEKAQLLLNRKFPNSGIIVCTLDIDFARQAKRIHESIERLTSLDCQLIRVIRPSR